MPLKNPGQNFRAGLFSQIDKKKFTGKNFPLFAKKAMKSEKTDPR